MKRVLRLFALFWFGLTHADPAPASQTRSVPAFHAINVEGVIEVEATIGKSTSVRVSGDPDLLDKITTTVKDGALVIDTQRGLKLGNRRLSATVTAPDLTSLALHGTGGLSVSGIANDSLAITVPGTGAVSVSGSTGSLRVVVDGTGALALKDLAAKTATVELNGTGQVKVRASQLLEAKITGTGAIEVHGNPARIKKSVTGTGSIQVR